MQLSIFLSLLRHDTYYQGWIVCYLGCVVSLVGMIFVLRPRRIPPSLLFLFLIGMIAIAISSIGCEGYRLASDSGKVVRILHASDMEVSLSFDQFICLTGTTTSAQIEEVFGRSVTLPANQERVDIPLPAVLTISGLMLASRDGVLKSNAGRLVSSK